MTYPHHHDGVTIWQIFKTPFGVTNTQNASAFYGGNDLSYQQKKKGVEHMVN